MAWHFLSDEEVALLQRLLDKERGQSQNTPSKGINLIDEGGAPEIYLAKPQDTVTAREDGDPVLAGEGTCDVYRITETDTGPEIDQLEGLTKDVFNFSTSEISSDEYVVIARTKSGRWIPLIGGGGSKIITFEITARCTHPGTGTGTGTSGDVEECDCVEATVLNRACGVGSPEIGSTIEVFDELGCEFNKPDDLLIGAKGYAVSMRYETASTGTGTTPDVSCRWAVLKMCCIEET